MRGVRRNRKSRNNQTGSGAKWTIDRDTDQLSKLCNNDDLSVIVTNPRNGDLQIIDIPPNKKKTTEVLAYVSLDQAETWADYWNPDWEETPPPFVLARNKNYKVTFGVDIKQYTWLEILSEHVRWTRKIPVDGLYLHAENTSDPAALAAIVRMISRVVATRHKLYYRGPVSVLQDATTARALYGVALDLSTDAAFDMAKTLQGRQTRILALPSPINSSYMERVDQVDALLWSAP